MLRGKSHRDWPRTIIRRSRPVIGAQRPAVTTSPGEGVVPIGEAPRTREVVIGDTGHGVLFRQLIILGILSVLIIILVGGSVWALRGPYFRVSQVSITGNDDRIATADLLQKAGLWDQSMFTADLTAAQHRIAAMPLVDSVEIARAWPDSIKITVTERQPWGTWEQSGVDYVIDHTGVVIDRGKAAAGSPIIKSSEPGNREIGDHVDYQAVDAAAEIYKQLPAALGSTVSDVSFVAGKGVQVTTADGQTALFGDSSSIDYKLAVWAAVQKEAREKGLQYTTVDLRFGNRPVVR